MDRITCSLPLDVPSLQREVSLALGPRRADTSLLPLSR